MSRLFYSWAIVTAVGFILAMVMFAMLHRLNVFIRLIPTAFLVAAGLLSGPLVNALEPIIHHPLDVASWDLMIETLVPLLVTWIVVYFICIAAALLVVRNKPMPKDRLDT